MPLILTEEQQMLSEMAREFCADNLPVSELRRLRDSTDADGFERKTWAEAVELGWAGIPFPEELGGAGLGMTELGVVLEQCGRTLAATPLVATVLAAGNAVLLGGSETQRKEILGPVCAGETLLALAHQETPRFTPYQIATSAEASGGGYILRGEKRFVLDGHVADAFIVVARTAGESAARDGLSLFIVPADASGASVQRTIMVDGRNAAGVSFDGVEVAASAALGTPGAGADLLDAVLDRVSIGLSAELLGTLDAAFERTLKYLKERQQFGVPIGSFQALKHRAARMFVELELLRTVVLEAMQAVDAGSDKVARLAAIAKARASQAALLVSNECVQMHGGIGVTDEEDIGLFLKRARSVQLSFGDASYHRDRFATLSGY